MISFYLLIFAILLLVSVAIIKTVQAAEAETQIIGACLGIAVGLIAAAAERRRADGNGEGSDAV